MIFEVKNFRELYSDPLESSQKAILENLQELVDSKDLFKNIV